MAAAPIERKLAAILSADVSGYTRLMAADESATLAALSGHREVIDELIRQHGGRIANTAGDSILAEFPSVVAAVQCGVEIQQALAARNAQIPDEQKMLLRIGINVGDVMVKDQDIFGDGVNLAARLQGLAAAGGICISRTVRDQLRDKSPFIFEDQGEQSVKNIVRPVRVFAVKFEGLPGASIVTVASGAETEDEATPGKAEEAELAFWESITNSDAAADYSAYLERYPTGNFSALARARLTTLAAGEAGGKNDDVKLELAYWESVSESDDPEMLQSYLDKYPDGHFKPLALALLAKLTGDGQSKSPES
jgi:class 3 adenylate cyclase